MAKKIWLTTLMANREESPFAFDVFQSVQKRLQSPLDSRYSRFPVAESPHEADIILFVESNLYKTRTHVSRLLRNELIHRYPARCFAYDFQPEPPPLLPGVYASLPNRNQDRRRIRAGGYLDTYNNAPDRLYETACAMEPHYLFSFRGSARPHPIRVALLEAGFSGPDVVMAQTDKWFDYDASEKDAYAMEICRSKFVLCPRGVATSSFRMYETMALGRVPVVISDEWQAPAGVDWDSCIVRVAEKEIGEIPALLRKREPEWREMGRRGRGVWKERFHPDVALYHTLCDIEALQSERDTETAEREERIARRQWRSLGFAYQQGWTPSQQWYRTYRVSGMRDRVHVLWQKWLRGSRPLL